MNQVSTGGEVVIKGTYSFGETGTLGAKGKSISVSGDTLDLSETTTFNITGPVVLKNITVKANDNGSICANGNQFIVKETVSFAGTRLGHLYGGSNQTTQKSTYMIVKAGNYREIYGGGLQAKIEGDTYLLVGGNVNKGTDVFANDHALAKTYCIYGGSYSHGVNGSTTVVFDGANAVAGYIYAGGYGKYASVKGTSSVEMYAGTVYSIFGGSVEATEYAETVTTTTDVKMYGGTVAQIFGGSGSANLVGSTRIEILGGNVTRRIYGGCYNEYSLLGWASTQYHVIGTTDVILHDEATYGSDEDDNSICATSRWKNNMSEENATLTIETESLYNKLNGRFNVVMTSNKGYDTLIVAGQNK